MDAARTTFSLRWKILLWFFVNLLVLSVAIFLFLRVQLRLDINSLLTGATGDRLEAIAGPLAAGLHEQPRAMWPMLVKQAVGRWRSTQVRAGLFRDDGNYLTGELQTLPGAVRQAIEQHERRHHGPMPWNTEQRTAQGPGSRPPGGGGERVLTETRPAPPDRPPPDGFDGEPYFDMGPDEPFDGPDARPSDRGGRMATSGEGGVRRIQPLAMGPHDKFILRTKDPTRYWIGVHLGEMEQPNATNQSPSVTLVFASDTLRGGGLLFDYYPWLLFAVSLVVLSVLIWLPFVTGVIGSLGRMVHTAEDVSQGNFKPAHTSKRGDELGRLSRALLHMGNRLEEAANGQKRFLGDTAHELLSPLARLEMALSVLETQPAPENRERYTAQALEDVRFTSTLVQDLLAYAKAGLRGPTVALGSVRLADAVNQAVAREAAGRQVVVAVPEASCVRADADLLVRALANTVRNAVRYAGHAGPIQIVAEAGHDPESGRTVTLHIADRGPGVPAGQIDRLFEPFFRPETARTRETGGSGLGLAIVKSCVDACGGKVTIGNLSPTGLQVTFVLQAADEATRPGTGV